MSKVKYEWRSILFFETTKNFIPNFDTFQNNRKMSNSRMLHAANIVQDYSNSTFNASGQKLYLDLKTADVFFVTTTDDGLIKRVPAHKALLAAASDVFNAMFYGPLKEDGDITVDDTIAAIFEEFLQFFYFGRVTLTMENVAGVMHLGHKYNVSQCFKICTKFISGHLTYRNVCIGLGPALRYDLGELQESCEKKISKFADVVLRSAGFLTCEKHVLKHILNLDKLACSEKLIFKSCMAWVKNVSKKNELTKEIVENYLGDAFYDIRFASMKVEEFAALIDEHGDLFTEDDCKEIIRMIGLPNYQPKRFSKKLRGKFQRPELLRIDWMT